MKTMRKVFALFMALSMIMALAITANADPGDANDPATGETQEQTTEQTGTTETAGSLTITNAAKGVTYTAYKLFDATYAKDAQGNPVKDATGKPITAYVGVIPTSLTGYFEYANEAAKYVKLTADVTDEDLFAALKTWAATAQPAATAVGEGSAVVFDLPFGYYVVTSTQGNGAVITVDSANPDADIIDKNTTIPIKDLSKTVNNEDKSAKIGDTVTYTVSFATANWDKGEDGKPVAITKYTISDNFADDMLDDVTVTSITIGGEPYTEDTQFPIEIKWADEVKKGDEVTGYNHLYANGAQIVITYTAKIVGTAADGTVTNQVTVETNTNKTGNDRETIQTSKFTVNKVDGNDAALTGAEFKLFDARTGGNQIKVKKVSDGVYTISLDGTDDVIEAGTAVVKGLDGDKTYWLEETKAPDGYNQLTERKEVKFSADATTTYAPVGDAAFDAGAQYYTMDDGNYVLAADVTDDNFDNMKANLFIETTTEATVADAGVKVVNNAGTELPSTGGIGTTIFTVVGATLMVGAAVLFVTKKRSVM